MAEELRTNEKRCPKPDCASENVQFTGFSHAQYIGEKMSETKEHRFTCQDCGRVFWYFGEQP